MDAVNNLVGRVLAKLFRTYLLTFYYKGKKAADITRKSYRRSTYMSELLPEELKSSLPRISDQEERKDPTVYAVYQFPLSGWIWLVTEADSYEDDLCFFGYVVGFEREWGYFCLSELESVDINGLKVLRDEDHEPKPLSECLKQYGLEEN